jgi:hypothetical protein
MSDQSPSPALPAQLDHNERSRQGPARGALPTGAVILVLGLLLWIVFAVVMKAHGFR